ncbi:hypothetical protein FMUND_12281 [Fusarium mundagurra]|uniref:F-box domain-containing protein n=1 Tax=Fusarium mundagurra TaxID=1567541 RepID=A0A8H5Y334_9HYPO|nr:hypothetical protein FMUND_12281 [Fusarium mundagurra]
MEPEQRVEAVTDNTITNTSLSFLEEMPVEVLLMIATYLGCRELRGTAFVSKSLRSVLVPGLFKKIIFSGTLEKIAYKIRSLLNGEHQHLMELILSSTKLVTIRLEARQGVEGFMESILLKDIIAITSEFVSKLSSIHLIAFDFGVDNQRARCHLQTVVFPIPINQATFGAIMSQFYYDSFESLRLPQASPPAHRDILRSIFASAKGLKIDMSAIPTESRTLACIDDKYLHQLSRDFPNLHSLFLDQLDSDNFRSYVGPIRKKAILPNPTLYFDNLISRLKTMPQLRRFAFTLTKDWLVNEYECVLEYESDEMLSLNNTSSVISQTDAWPLWLGTVAKENEWHFDLVTRILNAVPQLKELCVVPHTSELYRGTKIKGTVSVRLVKSDDPRENSRFPSQLVD